MHVIDLEGNEYALQATTTNDYELNGNQSISFRILPSKVNKLFIDDITEMWKVVDHDDITHKIVYLKKQGTGDSLSVEVKAVPLIFDDLDSQRIYERYDRSMTANYCFNLIFEGSGYNFILNGTFESQEWEGFGEGDTRLTLFKKALERYKAEFRVSGNTVYIENRIGRDTQFMYRYRLNASNIVQENDATAYWTYAKGYGDYGDGDGGEDWQDAKLIREYTSPIASIIGKREAPPIKNGNITTQKTMDEQLKILVDESLKISVTATIHDLRKQGYALAQPEMGDRVFLIDERIGLNAEVRVVDMQLVRNWKGDVLNISLTFGTPGLVKRHQSNLQTAISNITQLLEGKVKLPFSVLDNAVAQATKALQNMQSELSIPDNGGLIAVDKSNPNNVVVFNAAGLGVSNDGGATFDNAITGNGINASVIVTGILHGITIIQESGNRSLEMSNGELFSYYNNKLAMKFGQFSLDFYNSRETLLGQIVPLLNENNETYEGLGLIVENDFINVGMRSGGFIRPVLRSSFYDGVTTLSGPYRNANSGASLRLFGNRRLVSEGRFSAFDQPAIILDQSDISNDVTVYYGGFGRRTNASTYFRHRSSETTYRDTMRIAPNYVRVYDELRVGGADSPSGIYPFANSIHWRYDINNYIRQQDSGRVDFYAGNNAKHSFDSSGNATHTGNATIEGNLFNIAARSTPTTNAANLHVFEGTGRYAQSTSSRKYKLVEEPVKVDPYNILGIEPKDWYDRHEIEQYAGELTKKYEGAEYDLENIDLTKIRRVPGLVAEDVEEVGLSDYVEYGEDGEIRGLMYDRLWTLLIPVVRELKNRVEELENGQTTE